MKKETINILLVEDIDSVSDIIGKIIESVSKYSEIANFEINFKRASTYQEALDIINNNHVDLVFLDVYLPDGYGINAIKPIKEKNHSAYVVITTSSDARKEMLRLYGVDYEQYLPESSLEDLNNVDKLSIILQSRGGGADDYIPKAGMNSETIFKSILYAIDKKKAVAKKRKIVDELRSIYHKEEDK